MVKNAMANISVCVFWWEWWGGGSYIYINRCVLWEWRGGGSCVYINMHTHVCFVGLVGRGVVCIQTCIHRCACQKSMNA